MWVHLYVGVCVSGPSIALLMQSSAVICVTDLSLMGEQLRTTLCHRGGVEARARAHACVCVFLCHVHMTLSVSILRCGHVKLRWCVPASVCTPACPCVLVCTCEDEQRCNSVSFPLPALAPCHSEEPGGDIRGRGGETLTAATCHISQLKFGGNQF